MKEKNKIKFSKIILQNKTNFCQTDFTVIWTNVFIGTAGNDPLS